NDNTQEEWSTMKKGTQRLSRLFAAMAIAGFASYSMAADTIKIVMDGPRELYRYSVERRFVA
ncbi:hypothetical protein CJT77_31925, partial [Pseudomonas aeruginosa]